jgi:hypothetical protein
MIIIVVIKLLCKSHIMYVINLIKIGQRRKKQYQNDQNCFKIRCLTVTKCSFLIFFQVKTTRHYNRVVLNHSLVNITIPPLYA